MDWLILPNMDSGGDGYNAQRRGHGHCLALLMAHRQWGSSGAINYYQQALNTINAMKAADFATNGVMYVARNVSRVSDYMPGHFRSFKAATNDTFWDDARTNSLALAQNVTTNYSPSAKLQPGFIYDPLGTQPAPGHGGSHRQLGHRAHLRPELGAQPVALGNRLRLQRRLGWGNLANDIVGR
jgi:hypothetical protein